MLTPEKAYEIVSREVMPLNYLRSCLDFGKFYLFSLCPINIKSNEDYLVGTVYDAVDKKTGKVFQYNILTNIDAYESAKQIKIKTIWDEKI